MAEQPKRKFVYRATAQGRKRLRERVLAEWRAELRAERAWPDAIHDAYHHKTTKLGDYLLNMNLPLDEDKRRDLVKLHDRRIHRSPLILIAGTARSPGRKKGSSIPPSRPSSCRGPRCSLMRGGCCG